MPKGSCGECRFWSRRGGDEHGDCRALPPRIIDALARDVLSDKDAETPQAVEHATRFPVTFIDEWCGSWTADEPGGDVVQLRPAA